MSCLSQSRTIDAAIADSNRGRSKEAIDPSGPAALHPLYHEASQSRPCLEASTQMRTPGAARLGAEVGM